MNMYIIENDKRFPCIVNHFECVRWVTRAVSKDKNRGALQNILIKDGIYYATDGHRLHAYCPQDMDELPVSFYVPDGQYRIKTNSNKQIVLMPDNDNIFPDIDRLLNYRPDNGIPAVSLKQDRDDPCGFNTFVRHLYSHTNYCFNLDYLRDACFCGVIKFDNTKIYCDKPNPIVFSDEERLAMVMPLLN